MNDEGTPKGPHETAAQKSDSSILPGGDDVPQQGRPWAGRPDVAALEERFRRDRDGWRRRIAHARRMSHDVRDDVAPNGAWTL